MNWLKERYVDVRNLYYEKRVSRIYFKDADGFATDSDENLQKGSLYKFIFTKVENDYAFNSSELVE